jgi:L-fuconolactonase
MNTPRIDAHHHLWKYTPHDYAWIADTMQVLRQDYLLPELEAVTRAGGIDGTIAVQARQTVAETEWLLHLAEASAIIRGVVGWVPLVDPGVEAQLEALAARPELKGIRHVLQDEPDDHYMLGEDFQRGVALLSRFGLCYDILIYERHLPQALTFVDRHPNQLFVLDHIAKPRIQAGEIEPWKTRIAELARRPNVYCKLSGMVTEAGWSSWTPAALKPYFDAVLEAFTPQRLMFGSDWPVIQLASTYERWLATVQAWIAPLSAEERARILGGTAAAAYRL